MSIKSLYRLAWLACAIPLLSACGEETLPADTPQGNQSLSFSVGEIGTRLTYVLEHTTFDDQEQVGCVVAAEGADGASYTYLTSSLWHYDKKSGFLVFDNAKELKVIQSADISGSDPSYIISVPYFNGNQDATLRFFFYYPYDANVSQANWQQHVVSANVDQGGVDQDDYSKINQGDAMWVASRPVTEDRQSTQNLFFQKKAATILVYAEEDPQDFYFYATKENTLRKSSQIDLSTGELGESTDYFAITERIIPFFRGTGGADLGLSEDYYFYRLVLPAQKNPQFSMHLGTIGTTEINKDIDLSQDFPALEEGKLYTIRVSKQGSITICINDWQEGGELVPVPSE